MPQRFEQRLYSEAILPAASAKIAAERKGFPG